MLGHDHISVDDKAVFAAGFLQDFQKQVATFRGAQLGLATVAAASNEMKVLGAIVAMQSLGHPVRVTPRSRV